MRTKEDAHDYRYFPDPDLPPLVIEPAWIERVRAAMPELPAAMAARLRHVDGLPADAAALMTQSQPFARYYEAVRDGCGQPRLAANWLMGEVSKRLNAQGLGIEDAPLAPARLAELICRVADGTVSNSGARQVFDALWQGEVDDVDGARVAARVVGHGRREAAVPIAEQHAERARIAVRCDDIADAVPRWQTLITALGKARATSRRPKGSA